MSQYMIVIISDQDRETKNWPCLDTLAGLELELVSNSSSSPKLTLALEVFG
jgi:hypothetical protein